MENKTSYIKYSLGLLGLTLLSQLFHSYSYSYFVDYNSLITMAMASFCKIIFVFVDGINDVIFGFLSEKTKSKFGKRLPWIIYSIPLFPLCVILTYCVNKNMNMSPTFFFLYYLIISILFENVSTIQYLNYGALFPLLFKEGKERNIVSSYKHAFEVIGVGICLVLTPLLAEYISFFFISIIYSLIYVLLMVICVKSIHYDKNKDYISKEKYSFKKTVKDFISSKQAIIYYLSCSFTLSSLSILMTLYPLFSKYVLKITFFEQGLLMGILFICVLISILIWYKLLQKIGHRKCYLISYISFPFLLALLAIPSSFIQALIVLIFASPFVGGILITPDLMSSELIDIDKKKNKVSREASFLSLGTLTSRITIMIISIFITFICTLLGYKDGNNPGNNPSKTFKLITGLVLPLISLISSGLSILYIKISKKDYEEYKKTK